MFDGFKALDVESFSLGFYELRVIIGPNGAGKTTLCDAISGKTRAATGKIQFAGRDVTSMPEIDIARLGVGRKFQTPTVFDSLTVFQNMELALPGRQGLMNNLVGRTTAAERERIYKILRRVRLYEHLDRQVKYPQPRPAAMVGNQHADSSRTNVAVGRRARRRFDRRRNRPHGRIAARIAGRTQHYRDRARHGLRPPACLPCDRAQRRPVMADGTLDQVQANPEVIEAYLGR